MKDKGKKVDHLHQVSVVVCALNEENRIEDCLRSLKNCGVGELILVDGRSTDNTIKLAANYADKILFDDGIGLGAARNIGIAASSKPFILNCGADNSIDREALNTMVHDLAMHKGVSCKTIKLGKNYLNRCLNIYRQLRFSHGVVSTIGTPSLFHRETLAQFPFETARKASDDSEICERISRDTGGTFYISNVYCFENGIESFKTIKLRWKNLYGLSDFEVYEAGKTRWHFGRRLQSILYPSMNEFLIPMSRIRKSSDLEVIPFLFLITALRYIGWFSYKYGR